MIDTLILACSAVLICLVVLHLLDRRLEEMDRLRRAHEDALKRAHLIQHLRRTAARRTADLTEPGDAGDDGGVPQWPNQAA